MADDALVQAFAKVVDQRQSIRAFLPEAVPESVIERVFQSALRAPSNCNTQPWFVHVVTGATLERLRARLPDSFEAGRLSLDFPYEGRYEGVYRERQFESGRVLYDALGIERQDKAKRHEAFLDNFRFFGAPAVAFFTLPTGFGLREACDLGMFAQTVMLGLTAEGLGSCPQTALAFLSDDIRAELVLPASEKIMFGLSFGYPDHSASANQARTSRADLGEVLRRYR
jgi:nitroreductase